MAGDLNVGRSSLTILLSDENGQPVRWAQVSVRGDMSHAGMAPVNSPAHETEPGTYMADLEWTMAGDWIVTVSVTRAGEEIVERQFDLSVEGPGR